MVNNKTKSKRMRPYLHGHDFKEDKRPVLSAAGTGGHFYIHETLCSLLVVSQFCTWDQWPPFLMVNPTSSTTQDVIHSGKYQFSFSDSANPVHSNALAKKVETHFQKVF
jgi:hypothetical protein